MPSKLYLERLKQADAKDTAKAARKLGRAQKIASSALEPATAGAEANSPLASASAGRPIAVVCGHGEVGANSELKICDKCRDSIRWTSRVPRGLSEDAQQAVEKIVASGAIRPARKRPEIRAAQEKESSSSVQSGFESVHEPTKSSLMKEVVESTSGKPEVRIVKPPLPEGVEFEDAVQARHLGKCVLMRGMNFAAGVKEAYPKLSPSEASSVAYAAQTDPSIRAAIEEAASQRGLSEEDKQTYVSILWRYAASTKPGDYTDRGVALRLLGKVFLPEKIALQTPANLPINGFQEGLAQMGLADADLTDNAGLASVAMPALAEFEEDDEETE